MHGHVMHTGNHGQFQKFWKKVLNLLKNPNQNILDTKIHCGKDGFFEKTEKNDVLQGCVIIIEMSCAWDVCALSRKDSNKFKVTL